MVEQRHLAAGAILFAATLFVGRHGLLHRHGSGPSFGGTACVSGGVGASAALSAFAASGGGAVAGIIGGLSSPSTRGNSRMIASFCSRHCFSRDRKSTRLKSSQ